MIRSVIFTDAGVYTCTNEQFSKGGPATVNVTITMDTGMCEYSVYILLIDAIVYIQRQYHNTS